MFISTEINPYVIIEFQKEFEQSIAPAEKRSFTETYKKSARALEKDAQSEVEPMEEIAQVHIPPADVTEFPWKEASPLEFREMYEREHVDCYV